MKWKYVLIVAAIVYLICRNGKFYCPFLKQTIGVNEDNLQKGTGVTTEPSYQIITDGETNKTRIWGR